MEKEKRKLILMEETNSAGDNFLSYASENCSAASFKAPPKRGPMVSNPEQRDDTRSFPALAETMVLWAPDTAGP